MDMLVGKAGDTSLRKVQVKTARSQSWYVNMANFQGKSRGQNTVYVLLGSVDSEKSARFFIVKNRALAKHIHKPSKWRKYGFVPMCYPICPFPPFRRNQCSNPNCLPRCKRRFIALTSLTTWTNRRQWLRAAVAGCPACKVRINSMSQFLDHLANDVMPRLLDRLSSLQNREL
jgi:hypothetical protein